jgi:hypothetical protein
LRFQSQIRLEILIAVKSVDSEVMIVGFITGEQQAVLVDLVQQERIGAVQIYEIYLVMGEHLLKLGGDLQRFRILFVEDTEIQIAILMNESADL